MEIEKLAEPDFRISPSQGLQIMAIGEMLRTGELEFKLNGGGETATAALIDVSQEIALQIDQGESVT